MAERLARAADPYERAVSRLSALVAFMDSADPLQVASVPPLFIDVVATEYGLAPQRCVNDCLTLVHAYAQLGIPAQVHAVELSITDAGTGTRTVHGSLCPRWEDDMIHGHTVVWLPEVDHLVDVTAEQFTPIAEFDEGPVILAGTSPSRGGSIRDAPELVSGRRRDLQLIYTLAPPGTTAELIDHPQVRAEVVQHRRHGLNLASASVVLLAEVLTSERAEAIPHPRAAALVRAVRDLPERRTPSGDWRFVLTNPEGDSTVVRLDRIPLPKGTPAVLDVPSCG